MSFMTNFSTGSIRRGFILSEVGYFFYQKNRFCELLLSENCYGKYIKQECVSVESVPST